MVSLHYKILTETMVSVGFIELIILITNFNHELGTSESHLGRESQPVTFCNEVALGVSVGGYLNKLISVGKVGLLLANTIP